jgi:glycosyltransferase involved in cell wall biosynthesis
VTAAARRSVVVVGLLVAVIVVAWILAIPRSAGPDEPGHLVRSGALVRGELDGVELEQIGAQRGYELPAHVGFPDPGCFAFDPFQPATCATGFDAPDETQLLGTRSADYPIWGHLLPGVGTYAPASSSTWVARLLDALVPIGLVTIGLVLAARRSRFAAGSTLFALTPLAWFTFSVVNPSGLVVAGGFGLWIAIMDPRRDPGRVGAWLTAISWAALVLPRRDGMVWATLILALGILIADVGLLAWWRRLGLGPQLVVAASSLATLAWASTSNTNASLALFATPLAPIATELGRRIWRSLDSGRTRVIFLAVIGLVGAAGAFGVMDRRAAGFDRAVLRATIGQTGADLREAVGLLGWLDTPVPTSMVFLWMIGIGLLVAVSLVVDDRRALIGAVAILGSGIASSWVLTMLQNDPTGLYWQGRYYLPLLVGVPVVLGAVPAPGPVARRLGGSVALISIVVVNVALAAMMRRFGVGISGSLLPWDWDTYGAPLPPIVLLVVHAFATIALVFALDRIAPPVRDIDTHRPGGVNVVGYHHVASGLGQIAREIDASLREAGVPTRAIDVTATVSPALREPQTSEAGAHDTTVAVVAAAQLPAALDALPDVRNATERLIGYWFWELSTVPSEHHYAMGLVDEIWAPTRFVADAYRAEGERPVRLVPIRVPEPTVEADQVAGWRNELLTDDSEYLFLVSFDYLSVLERKNPFAAIDAFRMAFPEGQRARLVIKTINGDVRPDDRARVDAAALDDDRISVVDRMVGPDELDALIAAADCYVSLHRSEGLGLHLAAAMWCSTPVIATAYSGNLDLMDDEVALLVDAVMVPVAGGRDAYPPDAEWAEPDVSMAATQMRRVVDDPDAVIQLARRAHERMAGQPSRAEIGREMACLLGVGVIGWPQPAR